MSSVADNARMMRQLIAERNLSSRLTRANEMLGAIASIGAPSVPDSSSPVPPPMSPLEVSQQLTEMRKQQMTPCPTGYVRNGRGDCVILITSSEGLPLRTEDMAMNLTQNIAPLGFEQVYRGTTAIPGAMTSTELQLMGGLGAYQAPLNLRPENQSSPDWVPASTPPSWVTPTNQTNYCASARNNCARLNQFIGNLERMLQDCALFAADEEKSLTMDEVRALLSDLRVASSQCASLPPPDRREQLWGMNGGLGYDVKRSGKCQEVVDVVELGTTRYLDIMQRYQSMRGRYPGVGGPCKAPPRDMDTSFLPAFPGGSSFTTGGGAGGGGGGGGEDQPPPPPPPPPEEKSWMRTPLLILGLTVGGLVAYRFATRAKRQA